MDKFIPYGKQWIDDKDIEEVIKILKSDYITQGPKIKEFEDNIANLIGTKYCVAVSNGTAALHAACFAAGVKPGDEVITTPLTFAASSNCALYLGAKPVFADINPVTYNIDPDEIEKKITSKTKAIIPVHYTGAPCEMDRIMDLANKYNLVVIEDAAHALGAEYNGLKVGSIGDMAEFSFHPVKHITTGEGGAITTNNREYYQKLLMFRTHGITKDEDKISNNDPWHYEQQFLGYNYRITDIQAALGLGQLSKLNQFIEKRIEIVKKYNEAFKNIDTIITPVFDRKNKSAWHLYVVQIKFSRIGFSRKEFCEELRNRKIGTNVHYIPVYYHPYYQSIGYEKGLCPNTEEVYESIVTLPLYPKMTHDEVDYVIENVIDLCSK